jgi:hypothetical protein
VAGEGAHPEEIRLQEGLATSTQSDMFKSGFLNLETNANSNTNLKELMTFSKVADQHRDQV